MAAPESSLTAPSEADDERRVLLIEDNASERWLYTEILRTRGFHVTACADADRGLELWREQPSPLVLLDLKLPGTLDGYDLCRRIRRSETHPSAVILVITGEANPDTLERVMDVGADDYITKPIDAKLLNIRLAVAEREVRSRREKERTREKLERATLELRRLFENLDDVFLSVDLERERILQLSPSARELMGVDPEALLEGRIDGIPVLFPDDTLVRLRCEILAAPEETIVHSFDCSVGDGAPRRIEGRYKGVLADGELVRIDGIFTDVTARHEAQLALARQNEEIQSLARVAELALEPRDPEEIFRAILGELCDMTGFPKAILAVRKEEEDAELELHATFGLEGALNDLGLLVHGALLTGPFRTGRPIAEGELEERRGEDVRALLALGVRSSLIVPLRASGGPIGSLLLGRSERHLPSPGQLRLASGVARTLSAQIERLEGERALRDRERRSRALAQALREANAELEAFTYTVSHDLRAPLRTMQGFAHTLLQAHGDGLSPEVQDHVGRIIASGERAEELISDLLEYSRLSFEAVELRPISLTEVVQRVREQLGADLNDSGAEVTVEEPLPTVLGQATILTQSVTNLVSNALKFVPDGATPRVVIRARSRGDRVRLEVQDNGIGIPPAKAERIFRVFERLTEAGSRRGTGIGLAIVRRGVERLGGTVGVKPAPGGGSTFWLDIPSVPR